MLAAWSLLAVSTCTDHQSNCKEIGKEITTCFVSSCWLSICDLLSRRLRAQCIHKGWSRLWHNITDDGVEVSACLCCSPWHDMQRQASYKVRVCYLVWQVAQNNAVSVWLVPQMMSEAVSNASFLIQLNRRSCHQISCIQIGYKMY